VWVEKEEPGVRVEGGGKAITTSGRHDAHRGKGEAAERPLIFVFFFRDDNIRGPTKKKRKKEKREARGAKLKINGGQ